MLWIRSGMTSLSEPKIDKETFSERFSSSGMCQWMATFGKKVEPCRRVPGRRSKSKKLSCFADPKETELFDTTDKDTRFFRNVGNHRPTDTAPRLRTAKHNCETLPKHSLLLFMTTDQWYKERAPFHSRMCPISHDDRTEQANPQPWEFALIFLKK